MGLFSKLKDKFSKKEDVKEEKIQEKYDKGLEKTRESFVSSLSLLGKKFTKVNEEYYEELERILIKADIGVNTVDKFMDLLRKRVKSENIIDTKYLNEVIVDELFIIYVEGESLSDKINMASSGPTVLLFVGVNGVGKTTLMKEIFKNNNECIEINDNIGDVININYLNFEILEVKEEEKGEQSTGIIIQIPSSKIFNYPIKNYSKAFKYIWKEMEINVPIDSDIEKDKKTLYKIINSNETLKKIPNKMKNQLNNVVGEYRIYYNNLDPIIYTSVVDNHVKLTIRFLCHPKKVRNIESDLWNKILLANKEGKIKLFVD